LCASGVLATGHGWCVTKGVLVAGAARPAGITERQCFADVYNQVSTERIRSTPLTEFAHWHGCTELWLESRWREATPAFNIELSERFGLLPLDFNGDDESIHHPCDKAGQRHMDYLHQRSSFDDLPLEAIRADFAVAHRRWGAEGGDFDADVRRETADPGRAA
jgi:hypothetical protein